MVHSRLFGVAVYGLLALCAVWPGITWPPTVADIVALALAFGAVALRLWASRYPPQEHTQEHEPGY